MNINNRKKREKYQKAKANGNEKGSGNGESGKVKVTQMTSQRLSDDSKREHCNTAKNGWPCYSPYFLEFFPCLLCSNQIDFSL